VFLHEFHSFRINAISWHSHEFNKMKQF